MSFDAFLKFSGEGVAAQKITGESQDEGMRGGWLEIDSFEFGIENKLNLGSGSGGAGAGKATFKEFKIQKKTDSASPALVLTCCLGGHYDQVDLALRKSGAMAGKSGGPYLVYAFKMVAIGGVDWSGSSGDDVPTESVIFQYGAIKMTYKPQDATGKLGTAIETIWSVTKNAQMFAT
ncbi:MAG TPA: type VI secretion system tube protein Hcp [Pirellulales bacterium]